MAQHGYLRQFDEAPDRSEGRERWRDEEQERGLRPSGGSSIDRQRGWGSEPRDFRASSPDFMFGERDLASEIGRGGDRDGFFRPMGDQNRLSYRGDSRDYRGADWERSPRNFRSHQDDHYRSWRNRQIEALDRDYADYCGEREQQFHRDFDDWRQKRQGRSEPLSGELKVQAEHERSRNRAMGEQGNGPSAVGAATLGTSNSENTGTGRGKPSA